MALNYLLAGLREQKGDNIRIISFLEGLGNVVDGALGQHGYAEKVAGGYVSGTQVLLTTTGTPNLTDEELVQHLGDALHCDVITTIGAIILDNPVVDVPETVDIMDLIAMEEENR